MVRYFVLLVAAIRVRFRQDENLIFIATVQLNYFSQAYIDVSLILKRFWNFLLRMDENMTNLRLQNFKAF